MSCDEDRRMAFNRPVLTSFPVAERQGYVSVAANATSSALPD